MNYAKKVIAGNRDIERLTQKEERGRIKGGSRNVEATIISRTSLEAGSGSKSRHDERQG